MCRTEAVSSWVMFTFSYGMGGKHFFSWLKDSFYCNDLNLSEKSDIELCTESAKIYQIWYLGSLFKQVWCTGWRCSHTNIQKGPIQKIAVSLKQIMWFWCTLRFRIFLIFQKLSTSWLKSPSPTVWHGGAVKIFYSSGLI